MRIAKDAFGNIGRQIPSQGLGAVIAPAPQAERRGTVNVSARSIADDQAYFTAQSRAARLRNRIGKIQAFADRKAEEAKNQAQRVHALQMQGPAMTAREATERKYKRHFLAMAQQPESVRVANSVKANFHLNEIVPSDGCYSRCPQDISWRSDFRQHQIVGNPLTRNGQFGPVSDYERIVQGTEGDNQIAQGAPVTLAGATMAGRFSDFDRPGYRPTGVFAGLGDDGTDIPTSDTSGDSSTIDASTVDISSGPTDNPYYTSPTDLTGGVDTSSTDANAPQDVTADASNPSWWSQISSGASSQLQQQLPALQAAAMAAIANGGKVTKTGNSIVISQPGKPSQTFGLSTTSLESIALIALLGLVGIVVLKKVMA